MRSGTLPTYNQSHGDLAFSGCTSLETIDIPKPVTHIGELAFSVCRLKTIVIPDSITQISYGTFLLCSLLNSVTIPDSVTDIGSHAFVDCDSLTAITIPAGISEIKNYAFRYSNNLRDVYFIGDAPTSFGANVFGGTSEQLTIFYLDTAFGFTSPTWNGYPSQEIDTSIYPDAPWLVMHSIPHDTDLSTDLNGDGVNLLMAYALGLDPRRVLVSDLPKATVNGNKLEMSFFAGRNDIVYRVETSTDLSKWTTDGVNLSTSEANDYQTASILMDESAQFMHLVIEKKL